MSRRRNSNKSARYNRKKLKKKNSITNENVEWKNHNIKRKMTNELIITEADKGKTLIILTQEEYKKQNKNLYKR